MQNSAEMTPECLLLHKHVLAATLSTIIDGLNGSFVEWAKHAYRIIGPLEMTPRPSQEMHRKVCYTCPSLLQISLRDILQKPDT